MGTKQSTLKKKGYKQQKEAENGIVATKGDDTFFIKKITLSQTSGNADQTLIRKIETLKEINHPHIVSSKNSFKDEDQSVNYIVTEHCQGGSLAAKIREMRNSPKESEVLSWIAEICVALKAFHEKGILHKNLAPENVLLTEFGTVCLDGIGSIYENSENTQSSTNSKLSQKINYLPPELFTEGTYDAKGDIWSVGCILYELCTRQSAFPAEDMTKLMPTIIGGPYPSLPESFSPELREILNDIFNKDHQSRPTASDILDRPIMIHCLKEKCKTTGEELQTRLDELRDAAKSLERVHQGTTIGSLTGGVIGAAGGVTSIVGLILAPFTFGASLIVTGVGAGVGVAGGLTASTSNVTNMVNQSSRRTAVRKIIKELEQKVHAVVTWLTEISNSLQTIRSRFDSANIAGNTDSKFIHENLGRLGARAGKGIGGIAELVRLAKVMNIGKIAAQASRAVRVAEVATGVFSALFVAADVYFIAMDAKEIHNIRQARATEKTRGTGSESTSETETVKTVLLPSSSMSDLRPDIAEHESDSSEAQDQSSPTTQTPVKSEIMKFVHSIRQEADKLQKVVDELNSTITSVDLEWQKTKSSVSSVRI